jgi:hypothetical protein
MVLFLFFSSRFLPDNPQDADRFGNCQPGTVVDKGIVFEKEFDFCK